MENNQHPTNEPDRGIPITDIILLAGALAYFVAPADLIPDFLPLGFADDTAALTFVFKKCKDIFRASDFAKANETAAKLLGDCFNPEQAAAMVEKAIAKKK